MCFVLATNTIALIDMHLQHLKDIEDLEVHLCYAECKKPQEFENLMHIAKIKKDL
jgi:hypothetical protein